MEFVDPVTAVGRGAKFVLLKPADLLPRIRSSTVGLHLLDLRVPDVEVHTADLGKFTGTLPAFYDLSGMPDGAGLGEGAASVRVLGQAGVGNGQVPETPGGLGRGADYLLHGSAPADGIPGSSPLDDAAQGAGTAHDAVPGAGKPGEAPPPRVYEMADGSSHASGFAPEQLDRSHTAQHTIDRMLGDAPAFERNGLAPWTRAELVTKVMTPVDQLTGQRSPYCASLLTPCRPRRAGTPCRTF